jgi:predicted phosphodiesterase
VKTDSDPAATRLIGFMADSHGRPETVAAALAVFSDRGCDAVYHLGDICDSDHPETAAACVHQLTAAGVTAVKGNNDHIVVANQAGRTAPDVPDPVCRYLAALPLRIMIPGAVLVHSLPFDREMGLSCMMGRLGDGGVRRFAAAFPGRILFRGHSHEPEAVCDGRGALKRVRLSAGDTLDLDELSVLALSCGALTRSFCMIWAPGSAQLSCHRI